MTYVLETPEQIQHMLRLFMDINTSYDWFFEHIIGGMVVSCTHCRVPMSLVRSTSRTPFYRCQRCRKEQSIFANTSIYRSKLKLNSILSLLLLIYIRSNSFSIRCITGIERHSIGYYQSLCRVALMEELQKNRILLGGPKKTVQIDEAVFRKRKYHRGAPKQTVWIFGMVEVEAPGFSRILLTRVDNRTRWCLIPLICRHVLPGTTIISDEWSAYKTLDIMSDYRHLTVNHSKTFKDPITGVTTNKIEGAWAHLRRFLPSTGVRDRFIEDFLAAFIMRNRRTITFPEFAKMVIYLKETEEAAHKDAIKTEDEVELHMSEAEKEIWHDLHERGTYRTDGDESVQENSIASHDEANSSDADEVPILGDLRDESSSSEDPYGAGTGEEASEYVDD